MGQIISQESIGNLVRLSNTVASLDPSIVNIGGQQYNLDASIVCDTGVSGFGGLDTGSIAINTIYSVYAVNNSGTIGLVCSLSSNQPTGFSIGKKVGRFNTDGSSNVETVSEINTDTENARIGSTNSAFLSEQQYQAVNGEGWVLSDGRDVTGSRYHSMTGITTIPDCRGQVIRGKNNGRSDGQENPDGDVALGTQQADESKSHDHRLAASADLYSYSNGLRRLANGVGGPEGTGSIAWTSTDGKGHDVMENTGGNESRMKNITANYFIKIN